MVENDTRVKAAEWMMRRGWKRLTAKRLDFEQSLFEHTMVELDALLSLFPILRKAEHFGLVEDEEVILAASVIAHDAGKEKPEWQQYILGRGPYVSDVDPELTRRIIPELCCFLGFESLGESVVNVMENCVNLHMRHERSDANVVRALLQGGGRWKTLADLVDTVDNICSAKGLFAALSSLERSMLGSHLKTAYHLVVLRGVSTPMIHRACTDCYESLAWRPFLIFGNGTLYVCSAAESMSEPSREKIESQLAVILGGSFDSDLADMMVGSPTATILPKPDLLDHGEVRGYLRAAFRRANRKTFLKKKKTERTRVVREYLRLKGEDPESLDEETLMWESQRIDGAHPQMPAFKVFKALMDKRIVGVNGFKSASEEYDAVFGEGSWSALQSTSTLMAAKDMAQAVDYFWRLPGERFGYRVERVEDLADEKKDELLVEILGGIAEKVFSGMESPPSRAGLARKMAEAFMVDVVKPAPALDLKEVTRRQWKAYGASKPFAGKETRKAVYFCPLCNTPFKAGVKAASDFLDKPQSHTNRAVSHGPFGYVMVCGNCKYERFLRQVLLGGKPAEMIVLFPRMNIGHASGEILVRKVNELYSKAYSLMVGDSGDPGHQVSLGLTHLLAANAFGKELERLTGEELAEVLSYHSSEDTRKKMRRTLEKRLSSEIGETLEDLNLEWGTDFTSREEAVESLIANRVHDPVARSLRAEVYRLVPQMKVVCQTPNMVLIPLMQPISLGKESETNNALRKLFISLLIALTLDMTVAVIGDTDEIDFEGGEGAAFVPPVGSIRNLIGSDWVSIEDAKKWFRAIGAAGRLAGATGYPDRSNLFSVLSAPTPGHILRRIEEKAESKRVSSFHINCLEMIKEVLH